MIRARRLLAAIWDAGGYWLLLRNLRWTPRAALKRLVILLAIIGAISVARNLINSYDNGSPVTELPASVTSSASQQAQGEFGPATSGSSAVPGP
jgi:hypothetical protein